MKCSLKKKPYLHDEQFTIQEYIHEAVIAGIKGIKDSSKHQSLIANGQTVNRPKDQIYMKKIIRLKDEKSGSIVSQFQGFLPLPYYLWRKFQERYDVQSRQMLVGSGFQFIVARRFQPNFSPAQRRPF